MKTRPGLSAYLAALAFSVMLAVNALATLLPLNGISTGAVSDAYPNLFAPAGLTFSIWGVIYLLLGLHTLFLLGVFRGLQNTAVPLERTTALYIATCLLNTAWIFAWHYGLIGLSLALMLALLVCLIALARLADRPQLSLREKLLVKLPVMVYFGWITVAAIANASVLLVSLGWNGFGLSPELWTVLMLAVGTAIGSAVLLRFSSYSYGAVLIWAYAGILYRHLSPRGFSGRYPGVALAAILCILIVLLACTSVALRRRTGEN